MVGVNVYYLAVTDLLLQAFPVIRIEYLPVHLGEHPAQFYIGEQKDRELFGKYVIGSDRVPRL